MGLAAVPFILMASATAVSGISQYQSSRYQEKAAGRNQRFAQDAARDAIQRGQSEESRHRLQVSRFMGKQRAVVGASGAVVDSGSTMELLEDTAMLGELDALTIRNNASREAWGRNVQAQNFAFEKAMASSEKVWGTAGSVLQGVSQSIGMGYETGFLG